VITYRIRNWNKYFENNRTRELKKLDWVMSPNKHDGDGFTELLDHENGMAHYGAWHLILQVASKCDPRGTLLRDGAGGSKTPHTAQSIARITRGDSGVINEAIKRLVSIGWLETYEYVGIIPQEGAEKCGVFRREGKGREGKGIEGKGREREPLAPVDSLALMVNAIQTARPEFKKIQEQAIVSVLNTCPKEIREKVVTDFVENTANMMETPRDPIGLFKGYVRTGSKDIKPRSSAPSTPRKIRFDEYAVDIAKDLWDHKDDDEGFKRCLSTWRDKSKDMPKENGISVIDEALSMVKRNRDAIKVAK
jgi:hypothetical protein